MTCTLFPAATVASTPLFGAVLLYDVIGIAVGQRGAVGSTEWSTRLGWTALAMGGIVAFKGINALRSKRGD